MNGNGSASFGQVALLFLLLLIPLIQILVPALRRYLEELAQQASEREEEGAAPPAMVVRTVEEPRGEAAKPRTTRSPPRARTAAPLPERRPRRGRAFDLREARRGIVTMTVLGPCRALDSAAQRSSENFP